MKTKFFLTGLVMAAVGCLSSCNDIQDNGLRSIQFENYRTVNEVIEGKSLDRTKFVLPANADGFGQKLYSVKTICFTDYHLVALEAKTCTATVYTNGIVIEVDGKKSYFDAEGLDRLPTDKSEGVTAMPSSIPGAPWQPALVIPDENTFWVYTSLYNRGDYAHRELQKIEGWYWTIAKKKGYKYDVLILD